MTSTVYLEDNRNYFNILLLGETGVGKSTFINSFANYLLQPEFEDAKNARLVNVIPSKFMVTTTDGSDVEVRTGTSPNEDPVFGNSSTQGATSYTFEVEGKTLRIIDTPGIGDARGSIKDGENFESILQYIGQLTDLHAICILLQPNVTVLTTFFKYCVYELLTRLNKTASANLVFLFTKTGIVDRQVPDSLHTLRLIAREMEAKDIFIPIRSGDDSANTFFFENEGFKYLAALEKGVRMRAQESIIMQTWAKSCKATWDLISYVIQLTPHKIQETISINEARRLIIGLSKPLVDAIELVQDNILALRQHSNYVAKENLTTEELEEKLFIPVVDIEQMELAMPVTVCTADKCMEIYHVFSVRKYHYKQRCHNPCYLQEVPRNFIGTPELIHCWAMQGTHTCTQCNCSFNMHMHIYYETKTVEKTMPVNTTATGLINQKQELSSQLQNYSEDYREEQEVIAKALAKFAIFFSKNSMCPVNEAYEDYLNLQISRQSDINGDPDLLQRYIELKEDHIKQKKLIEEASDNTNVIDSADIDRIVKELYNLPKMGKNIKSMHAAIMAGGHTERQYTECVVDMRDLRRPNFNVEPVVSSEEADALQSLLFQGNLDEVINRLMSLNNK